VDRQRIEMAGYREMVAEQCEFDDRVAITLAELARALAALEQRVAELERRIGGVRGCFARSRGDGEYFEEDLTSDKTATGKQV
jgi:hypothetical protein